jgi:uracil-DNA glycosylase family 4
MIPKPDSCKNCPLYEKPHGKPMGFSVPVGTGKSGVMVVAEALGEAEEKEGMALVGKSGYALFQQLKRVDIEREDLTLFNCIACRPPDNKLVGMPYMQMALSHCQPNLNAAIKNAKEVARTEGKTFVIVTLGVTAFKHVMGYDYKTHGDLLKKDYYAYPFWSDIYNCWVLNAPHPAFLVRGKTYLWPIVQFVFTRAIEIAKNGFSYDKADYLLDPDPSSFELWIRGYIRSLDRDPENPLSYDIETPYKVKSKDEDEVGKEEAAQDEDHTILRVSFSYFDGLETHTVSIKWSAEYMAGIEKLFAVAPYVLGWNSDKYDYPRVSRFVEIKGLSLDAMVAWHILNTSLPKALGFVTPFYWQTTAMWKHLGDKEPAFYNAKDADAALRNWIGIKRDLIANKLWDVYQRHWIELSKGLKYMSNKGVKMDEAARQAAETQLSTLLDGIEKRMEESVPMQARELKIFKKQPKTITEGMFEVLKDYPQKFCKGCGLSLVRKWKKHSELCSNTEVEIIQVPQKVWARPEAFKVSKKRMTAYQSSLKHQAILSRKEKKITFDADALTKLIKRYPSDKLYPTILEHRKVQKLLSTYVGYHDSKTGKIVGGMPVGRDGRIHTVYGRDASTLRYTSEDPNLQNLPRPNPKNPDDLVNLIRNLITAEEGSILYARDFSGIEAVLTGYFALDPRYIRLAKRDVHTYYTVYALHELEGGARIKACDLPDLDWPDDRLFPYLEQLKSQFKAERNNLFKHLVHAANFMQGAMGARDKIFSETGIEYPVKTVQKVMDVYYNLFPKIKQWHRNVLDEAEKDGYLRNPFGYVHRFNKPYDYKKVLGEWEKTPGPDANAVISFKPQSTAVGIITEVILRLYHDRFEEAGQFLRLQVHDELMFETPRPYWEVLDKIVIEEMERPIPQLPLPASWNMGPYLNVLSEAKADFNTPSRWGNMRGL